MTRSNSNTKKLCKYDRRYKMIVHKFPPGKYVCFCDKSTGKRLVFDNDLFFKKSKDKVVDYGN